MSQALDTGMQQHPCPHGAASLVGKTDSKQAPKGLKKLINSHKCYEKSDKEQCDLECHFSEKTQIVYVMGH